MGRHAIQNVMNPAVPSPGLQSGELPSPKRRRLGSERAVRKQKYLWGTTDVAMYKRIFLSAILGLAFLVWPSTLLPQSKKKEIHLTPLGGLLVRATGGEIAVSTAEYLARSQLAYDIVAGVSELKIKVPKLSDQASELTTGISDDRSILGTAPGALVPIPGAVNSCFSAGGVVFDPFGRFVLVPDSARNLVCVQSSDPETGALKPVPGSPSPSGGNSPERIAMDPSGQFFFVVNSESNNVAAFSFDLDTGALTPVPGSPFAAGSQPLVWPPMDSENFCMWRTTYRTASRLFRSIAAVGC